MDCKELHLISFLSAIGPRAPTHLFSNFLNFRQIGSHLLCVGRCVGRCGLVAHDPYVFPASSIHSAWSGIFMGELAAWTYLV